jgi:hypothetical protein
MLEAAMKEKRRIITLTNRSPVRIVENDWPVIAQGHCGSEAAECNIEVRVRRHRDGRAIVYGRFSYDYSYSYGVPVDSPTRIRGRVGHLSEADADLAASLRIIGDYVCERVFNRDMHKFVVEAVDDCFAHLPPTEVGR